MEKFRFVLRNSYPYHYLSNDNSTIPVLITSNNLSSVQGFMIDIIKYIADDLQFKYDFLILPKNISVGIENAEKTHLTGMLNVIEKRSNYLAGTVANTITREKYVHFLYPILTYGLGILIQKNYKVNDIMGDLFRVFSIFHSTVWILATFSILIVLIVLSLLNKSDKDQSNCLCYYIPIIFTYSDTSIYRKRLTVRIVLLSWGIFVHLFLIFFIAKWTAMFTIRQTRPLISSLNDLIKHEEITLAVEQGSNTEELLFTLNFEPFSSLKKRVIFFHSIDDCVQQMKKQSIVVVADYSTLQPIWKEFCDLELIQEQNVFQYNSFAVDKTFIYTDIFRRTLRRMDEFGIMERLKKSYWTITKSRPICHRNFFDPNQTNRLMDGREKRVSEAISFCHLSGIFTFMLSLYFICASILVAEKQLKKYYSVQHD
ncbi:hypothetical protein SNEBB_010250 [Seison nebaliae]|nr:hypothetical protein SNEBB_010250 [Seison nebaliae]